MYYCFAMNLFPVIEDFYILNNDPVFPELTDSSNILMIVAQGSMDIHYLGDIYSLTKGDVFFVPAGHLYKRHITDENSKIIYIHFSLQSPLTQLDHDTMLDRVQGEYSRINQEVSFRNENFSNANTIYLQNKSVIENEDYLNNILQKISTYASVRTLMYNLQISSLLIEIFIYLSQQTLVGLNYSKSISSLSKSSKKLDQAIEYIYNHFTEKITLPHLCEHCNISKSQLIRIFKSVLGTTPSQYIINYKLTRAKELLFYKPYLSIYEISASLGFENQHYFSKQFSKKYNESPSQYRARKLQADSTKSQIL